MTVFFSADNEFTILIGEMIEKACKRVLVACYLLSLPFILQKLVEKKRQGLDVRAVLGMEQPNQASVAFLLQNGVPVKVWRRNTLHMKMIVVDNTLIVTSANLTHYGLNQNQEIMLFTKNKDDVKKAVEYFEWLWTVS
ncbi:MAG: phospholipase D family protein [Candidatus Caldarchaeum sp.]